MNVFQVVSQGSGCIVLGAVRATDALLQYLGPATTIYSAQPHYAAATAGGKLYEAVLVYRGGRVTECQPSRRGDSE